MSKGRRYAVLIGSNRFDKEPNLGQLRCPENDVDGMREILSASELGAFEEPSLFKNADNYTVMHNIEETLSEATGADQVLIYYSGHGKMDLPGRLYLATTNTEVKLVTTSIPVETLRMLIENSSCRKIMLILDCCYGGAAGRSFMRGGIDDNLQELARGNGVYILTASTASQTAQEREGDDYGLLTKYIISGIKQGEADVNDDGYVSMDDLYRYVFEKVKSEGYQEPMRWALNVKGEDLIIARATRAFSTERLMTFKEMIMKVEKDLDEDVFEQAYRVIRENQPKRDKEQFALLEDLCEGRLSIGRFNGRWIKLSMAAMPQTKPESASNPSPLSTERELPDLNIEKGDSEKTVKTDLKEAAEATIDDKKIDDVIAGLDQTTNAAADEDDAVSSRQGFGVSKIKEASQSDDLTQSKHAETEWNRTSHDSSEEGYEAFQEWLRTPMEISTRVNASSREVDDVGVKISGAASNARMRKFLASSIIISIVLSIVVFFIVQRADLPGHYFNRGCVSYEKRDYDQAIADFTKAIELKLEDYYNVYLHRGIAYAGKRDYDRAIADFTKEIELWPNSYASYLNRGYAYAGKRDYDRAIADFTKAIEFNLKEIELHPESLGLSYTNSLTSAYINRGNAYTDKRDYDRAIADFTKAIELNLKAIKLSPEFSQYYTNSIADAYLNRGYAYKAKGSKDRAISDLQKSVSLFTDSNKRNETLQELQKLGVK